MTQSVAPVTAGDRLSTIDTLRGFALLGILLMNIPTYGLPEAAYLNPTVWTGNDWLDRTLVAVIYLFGEGKMRGIFSLMFGASALLFISRGEQRGGGLGVADVYYRRTLWLMLFGMIHGYLIWWGDILFPYALLGLVLFPFRKLGARALLITAGIQIAVLTGALVGEAFDKREKWTKLQQSQSVMETSELTKEQRESLDEGLKYEKQARRTLDHVFEEEVKPYQGNYVENMKVRGKHTWEWHSFPIDFPFYWDILSMMFTGMALYKAGVLTGERSNGFYWRMAGWGAAIGFLINGVTMWALFRHNFDSTRGFFDGIGYEAGRVPMSLCYVALLILAIKAGFARGLTDRLAAVGQMASSNYISHSLICSVIFYGGYGFGLIGKLDRWQVYAIVPLIWTFNLVWSPWWLKRYHFGPLEWCWRSLTYWKRQPWRIREAEPPPPPTELLAEPSKTAPADSTLIEQRPASEEAPIS